MAPAIAADGRDVETGTAVDLGAEVGIVEPDFGDLLFFGAVHGWHLFLHLGDGTVHAFPDEMALFEGDFRPVRTDLPSFRHMPELLHRRGLLRERERAGPVILPSPQPVSTGSPTGYRPSPTVSTRSSSPRRGPGKASGSTSSVTCETGRTTRPARTPAGPAVAVAAAGAGNAFILIPSPQVSPVGHCQGRLEQHVGFCRA